MIQVFLDANVYMAGFISDQGASFLILELVRRRKIGVVASRLVLREADRNLRLKAPARTLKAFRRFLQDTRITVVPPPSDGEQKNYESLIHPKDVPVLAAAQASKADYLITLDRRHFLIPQVKGLKKPRVMTSGEFVREVFLKGKI